MKRFLNRLPLSILILAPLPLLLTAFSFYFNHQTFQILEERYELLAKKQKRIDQEEAKIAQFIQELGKADSRYLENQLQSLKLKFVEETFRVSDRIQETEMRLEQPVELTEEELKQLLVTIDKISLEDHAPAANSPQLIVKQLQLSKKPLSRYNSLYFLNMQLIKRESAR